MAMKLVGMMPARNEAWCLGLSLRVALMWCDAVIVLDHASTDRTPDIVEAVMGEEDPGRVLYIRNEDPKWDEMAHRQRMLVAARQIGATHLAIIDADEVVSGDIMHCEECISAFRQAIETMAGESIMELPGYNLRNGLGQYHSNGVWGNRWFSTAFADNRLLHWGGDNFHHREPRGLKLQPYRPIEQGQGGVMHLWGASERRLIAKHALYKITEHLRKMRPDSVIDREYSWAIKGDPQVPSFGTPSTWTYSPVSDSWWAPYAHLMGHLDIDAEPWQEAEVRRLVAEHGHNEFSGLDLFGVA